MPETPLHVSPESAAFARSLGPFLLALEQMRDATLAVEIKKALGVGTPRIGALGQAFEDLATIIGENQMLSDLAARKMVLETADKIVKQGASLPGTPPTIRATGLPSVPFTEAVADIVAREPRLAMGAAEVSRAYGERHAFAVAKSTQIEVTKRVQKAIGNAIATGRDRRGLIEDIASIGRKAGESMSDWTTSYAETVWRTNMSTAYSAGRFRQMAEPGVQFAIGALMFAGPTTTPPAGDTRPNHAKAVGLIAAADDPVWQKLAPPLGYRCRHRLDLISWKECRRRGVVQKDGRIRRATIPAGAYSDPGFRHGGRPDQMIYGGSV